MTIPTRSYPNRTKSKANVTDHLGTYREKVGYTIVGTTAILRKGRDIIERADVENFERIAPLRRDSGGAAYNWRVSFANGESWTIEEIPGGCGCGR